MLRLYVEDGCEKTKLAVRKPNQRLPYRSWGLCGPELDRKQYSEERIAGICDLLNVGLGKVTSKRTEILLWAWRQMVSLFL
jgi:hypothetical protein